MIAEAIKQITDLAFKAAAPVKVESGDPRQIRYVIDGKSVATEVAPPPRDHAVNGLDDLISLANRFAAGGGEGVPVVWYDSDAVVLVIDDDGSRLEKATFRLEKSAAFACLAGLEARKPWLGQKDFIRLLRIDLASALPPVVLLNPVRKVKFENGVSTTRTVKNQEESLGRDITSRVDTDGKELPEEVTVQVDVYRNRPLQNRIGVRCSVEVDPAEGVFRLLPFPDELDRVTRLTVDAIGGDVSAGLENIPSYHGKP